MNKQSRVIFRIDNRLVHGQIAVNWKQAFQFNTIIVPDNELAADDFNQTLMRIATQAANLKSYFVSVKEAPAIINKLSKPKVGLLGKQSEEPIFIVCRTPQAVREIIDEGVNADKVTIWNMFKKEHKHQIFGTVYMDEEDLNNVKAIKEHNVEVKIQETPYSKAYEVPNTLEELK
ncbi:PTS sugar transporter subunit IIB [Pediococcus argentinicus]|uniref:PTS EIIB type-4 domain-containing protein n=1 Tax=Pediococcus argentinicus TaxID=480391 RepID=A0A0R2NQJ1_9LACO|nr:PTS sugar transporter subunit IIB [Pediococcus argentinicus]KRO25450.1 hypothetical protein IV88_GL000181 [Pediococcus argentinicus]NKZ22218.1 PTS sugar transporter subunit IIB [Pediococcus argentinicus]GEP19313.1 N-acetylgalactosamine-specific phosphotransferase enzyme IIB component 1 [Pediococcus argentinicus]